MRWYKNKYPIVNENVMVKCVSLSDTGVYCQLLEYDNIEALIPSTELSRQRIRSITQVTNIGRIFVACVLSIDEEKGYIDLSKKRVIESDIEECETRFNKSKKVASIVKSVCRQVEQHHLNLTEEEFYEHFIWTLQETYKLDIHILDILSYLYKHQDILSKHVLPDNIKTILIDCLSKHLISKQIQLQCEIELTCFSVEGIEGIKSSIREGLLLDKEKRLRIRILSAPIYIIHYIADDKEKGIEFIYQVIEKIGLQIRKYDGSVSILGKDTGNPIKILNDEENDRLKSRIETIIRENEQTEADDEECD